MKDGGKGLLSLKAASERFSDKGERAVFSDVALQLIEENIDLSNKMQVKESIVEKILDLIKKDLSKLGIVFDSFISEKVIHEQGDIKSSFKHIR